MRLGSTTLSVFLLFNVYSVSASIFPNVLSDLKLSYTPSTAAGDPLILTPFLHNGSIELAQNLSRVPLTDKIGFSSHAGFLTVDKIYNSNMYFWYFPPFIKKPDAPVLLWLQGGPGGSSLVGLFLEIGPLKPKKEGFTRRKYHWALDYHLIFIDNPVGTGFSFTDHDAGYCNDQDCVAKNLYECLQQFFTLFPNLRDNDFYITGESYAGKYIPSLGMEIHQNNFNQTRINLKGMALGNAYCDPVNMLGYGEYLYQHGLLDAHQRTLFEKVQAEAAFQIKSKNWAKAVVLMDLLVDGALANFSFYKSFTGFDNLYNFLEPKDDLTDDVAILMMLVQNDSIRRSVHVGRQPFSTGEEVLAHLTLDMLKSVAESVAELLSHYRMLFYNGQLDIIVAYPLTENFLRNLDFTSAQEYKYASRRIWRVGDDLAGYVKTSGNLTEVMVRNAGHMVPRDQPMWSLDMIKRFINKKI